MFTKQMIKIWWAFFWRNCVLGFAIIASYLLALNFLLKIKGVVSLENMEGVFAVLDIILVIPAVIFGTLFVLWKLIGKDFGDFCLMIVPKGKNHAD